MFVMFDALFSNECRFIDALMINGHLYASDYYGKAIKVISTNTRQVIGDFKTEPLIPRYFYNIHWFNEVWANSWDDSTFNIIKTDKRYYNQKAVRFHITPGERNLVTHLFIYLFVYLSICLFVLLFVYLYNRP